MKGKSRTAEWTESELQILKDNYAITTTKQLLELLPKRTRYQIDVIIRIVGLKKDKKFISEFLSKLHKGKPNSGAFKKGQTVWNKGLKMADSTKDKIKHTLFKKGNLPVSTKPILSERIDKRDNSVVVKVGHGDWVPKSRYLWEQANGKIPDGYKITFKDGDNNNFDLPNLEMVHSGNMLMRNSGHQEIDNQILETNRLVGKLRKLIKIKKQDGD